MPLQRPERTNRWVKVSRTGLVCLGLWERWSSVGCLGLWNQLLLLFKNLKIPINCGCITMLCVWKRRWNSTKILKPKSKQGELTFVLFVFASVFFNRWNEERFIYHYRKRRIWERREKCGQKCGGDNACCGQQWSNFKGIFVCFSFL